MTELVPTPGQTVGPFFGYALPFDRDSELVPSGHKDAVRLHGRVLDGVGAPVPDALLELWQPDESGDVPTAAGSLHRDGFTFTGWGRSSTNDAGEYSFSTVVPGAPFFAIGVFARGLLNRLFTRAYLPTAADDPFLQTVDPERRETLVATADDTGFVFDVHLQGERETVFLTYPRH